MGVRSKVISFWNFYKNVASSTNGILLLTLNLTFELEIKLQFLKQMIQIVAQCAKINSLTQARD